MANEEHKENQREYIQNSFLSPRFKSVAAMAGWDEESLLSASLIVDDTPDRELTHKKRVVLHLKTPPSSNSRKSRRIQRSPVPIVALDLSDVGAVENATEKDEKMEEKEIEEDKLSDKNVSVPCLDKLREELSCAICLDICHEPSTTPCGHSFCLKCLRFAASKCGKKCPKCRQIISNGRSCTINTVLWNTIQLLFPQEVEAKKKYAAGDSKGRVKIQESAFYDSLRRDNEDSETTIAMIDQRRIRRTVRASSSSSRAAPPAQDEDAAMALRVQREEFMGVVRSSNSISSTSSRTSRTNGTSFSSARENLRAMASRATNHVRGWNF